VSERALVQLFGVENPGYAKHSTSWECVGVARAEVSQEMGGVTGEIKDTVSRGKGETVHGRHQKKKKGRDSATSVSVVHKKEKSCSGGKPMYR